jgi:hypothetical protein
MATTTNYSWSTPDDTDLVKDGAAAIRTLGSSIDTTTKALNPSTTLGDIEYRSSTANTNTRLGVGSTGQVLTVAAGVPSWSTPAASGGMTLLSTTTLTGTSVTIGSISQDYKHLLVVVKDAYANGVDTPSIRFNADTGTNYAERYIRVIGTTVSAASNGNASSWRMGVISTNTDWSNKFAGEFWIWRYTDTSAIQSTSNSAGYDGSDKTQYLVEPRYNASAAITSITVFLTGQTFTAGTVYIYGVK